MTRMAEEAARGLLALQLCRACGRTQYPPRELCSHCLADAPDWQVTEHAPGTVLAQTVLRHSHLPHTTLPRHIGLVQFDSGPTAVAFLAPGCEPDAAVLLRASLDDAGRPVLTAYPVPTAYPA
jgi:uncharacterized OB-fold protein